MQDARRTVAALKDQVERFCAEREWDRFHGAKESAIGAATEAAELLELFRFEAESDVDARMAEPGRRQSVEEELSDVLFFLLRFAQRYGIDLSAAFDRKMASNAARYPVEKARGSKRKYTEL